MQGPEVEGLVCGHRAARDIAARDDLQRMAEGQIPPSDDFTSLYDQEAPDEPWLQAFLDSKCSWR